MRPIAPRVLQQLDLAKAATDEVKSARNLLPPEPDWSQVQNFAQVIAKAANSRLGSGMIVRPLSEVSARKSRHGLRPLPFMALQERVAYAALTQLATKGMVTLKRAPEDWLEFSRAPANYGAKLAPTLRPPQSGKAVMDFGSILPWSSPIKYVIKTDVVAFYRHVDHRRLHEQLIILGADFEVADHLIEFLGELQGRASGLPQLHESSDMLSEIYIDAVERSMLRLGYPLWRFNDDFRIACRGYMDTLRSMEDLDRCLREMSLTLNEVKTSTPSFANYYLEVMGLEVGPSGAVVARQEVEDIVGDYTDDFSQDVAGASKIISNLTDAPQGATGEIDVRKAGGAEARLVRRALAGLARARDESALGKIPDIVRYLAELTPGAVRYLLALQRGRVSRVKIASVLDDLATKTATNDWQKMWIIHGYVGTSVLGLKRNRSVRIDWLKKCAMPWSEQPLQAYATWALAIAREIGLEEILAIQRKAPECLHLYYAEATRLVGTVNDRSKREKAFANDLLLKKLAAA